MLEIKTFTNRQKKQQWLRESFDPRTQTLLLADLESKSEWQRFLLESKEDILLEDSVLRATELWQKLILRRDPQTQVVSPSLVRTAISQWLSDCPWDWGKAPGSVRLAYDYLEQFLPILANERSIEIMGDWFQQNKESYLRWGQWFELAYQIWQDLEKANMAPSGWVPAKLVSQESLSDLWSRPLVVDLGADLSAVEVDILRQLSESINVVVLAPTPDWESSYFTSLWPYALLQNRNICSEYEKVMSSQELTRVYSTDNVEFRHFSTELAEVKSAVARLRGCLDKAMDPARIVVAAPDIEKYWKPLSHYLQQEGLPFNKRLVTVLHSFPQISQWLSQLRIKMGSLTSSDLELSYYFENDKALDFEKFRQLFYALYDEKDLVRSKNLESLYRSDIDGEQLMARDDFIAWSLSHWTLGSSEALQMLFDQFLRECPRSTQLQARFWLSYLQQLCSRVEVSLEPALPEGVRCLNIDEIEAIDFDFIFIMGLTEPALKDSGRSGLGAGEVLGLAQDTGFNLQYPDRARLEFKLRWVLDHCDKPVVLSAPASDFSGRVSATSLLWLRGAMATERDPERVDIPELTHWDEIQRLEVSALAKQRDWSAQHRDNLERQLKCDMGEVEPSDFAKEADVSLSVSQIERFKDCPFKFAAEKIFKLRDLAVVDLDIDAATRGSLIHAIFRRLTEEPIDFSPSRESLSAIIKACRDEVSYPFVNEVQWSWVLSQYIELAEEFLRHEKQWREKFPKTKTIGRESKLSASWDEENNCLVAPGEGGYPFTGSIDRIDTDGEGHHAVIDYKSTGSLLNHFNRWVEKDKYQLAIYSQAVASGLSEVPRGEVLTAVYYVARDFNRDKGFRLKTENTNLYNLDDKKGGKISPEQLQELYQQVNEAVGEVVGLIKSGQFAPKPRDKKDCGKCRWRTLCRAPHLN